MKKIFSILSAGLMLLALGSCVKEQLAVFNPATDATAPVLGTYTVNEDGITANYTPGVFSINENIAPKHAFALVEVDGEAVSKILTSSNKDGALFNCKFGRFFPEEKGGCGLDAVRVASEKDGIEVHVHNLLLGIVALQLDGGDPLFQFDPDHLELAHPGAAGVEGLGQLLGDGGSASLGGVAGQERAEKHAAQGLEVYARMFIEAFVLRGHAGLHQRGGQFFVAHESAVFYMISGQDLAFLGNHLGGQLGIRVLQFFDGRDIGQSPDQRQQHGQGHHRGDDQEPEPLGQSFLACLGHSAQKNLPWYKTLGLGKNPVYKNKQKIWKIAPNLLYFAENLKEWKERISLLLSLRER